MSQLPTAALFEVVSTVVVLVIAAWVAIFGGIGALLAHTRHGSAPSGFCWGTFLGPVGWAVIWVGSKETLERDPGQFNEQKDWRLL